MDSLKITLGDNKKYSEYSIHDISNVNWKGDDIQDYYNAKEFYVKTKDGVDHYVERDELSVHDEKLLDRWVGPTPIL